MPWGSAASGNGRPGGHGRPGTERGERWRQPAWAPGITGRREGGALAKHRRRLSLGRESLNMFIGRKEKAVGATDRKSSSKTLIVVRSLLSHIQNLLLGIHGFK